MNENEATKIIETLAQSDGGCIFCVRQQFNSFVEKFPQFKKLVDKKDKEMFE